MSREELELMWQLKRTLGQVGEFVVDFSDGDLDPDRVLSFSKELADLAEGLRRQAVGKLSILNGEVLEVRAEQVVEASAVVWMALPVGEPSPSP